MSEKQSPKELGLYRISPQLFLDGLRTRLIPSEFNADQEYYFRFGNDLVTPSSAEEHQFLILEVSSNDDHTYVVKSQRKANEVVHLFTFNDDGLYRGPKNNYVCYIVNNNDSKYDDALREVVAIESLISV